MSAPRRYLITGGTSGIGEMCALHLAAQGHRVWVTGTSGESVASALDGSAVSGGTVCDVTDIDSVTAAFTEAAAVLGGLDGVFLNAGIDGECLPAEQLDPANVRRVFDVNVLGVLNSAQAAHRTLQRPGAIVINASVNAMRPENHFADYNSSKAAAAALASSLALEWSMAGLCITCICPGYFRTRMTAQSIDDPQVGGALLARIPAGRFGEPTDIGATVSFLLSNQAPFLSGACIPIAGAANI
jgi:NAD(P)-dependent dehydrogenase (short-subunit alcohol dehydrogenase family)